MTEHAARTRELHKLAARLGFQIKDDALFDRALTHASIVPEANEPLHDYESLEFLGDAVLGLAVAHHLFEVLPNRTPGEYSRLRAGVVNRKCVARVGRHLDIVPTIRLGRGEELSGGRERVALVADCTEALIGALYVDSGWDIAHAFVVRVFEEEIQRVVQSDRAWDYKSRLQHYCQAEKLGLPRFEVVREDGPDHDKEFEVEVYLNDAPTGRGVGASKKEAEQQSAREALRRTGQEFD